MFVQVKVSRTATLLDRSRMTGRKTIADVLGIGHYEAEMGAIAIFHCTLIQP